LKAFLDTNVLIAASVRQHPHFARADAVLRACLAREIEGIIHVHSLLEFHSAITQLPKGLAVPPAQVPRLLEEGILAYVRQVALPPEEVADVIQRAAELGLAGGIIYDLYHLAVAEREKAGRFYTFNTGHFQALAPPHFAGCIVAP
jgi:predicted nucleic acid-binding protein